jgi:hypothetical protein
MTKSNPRVLNLDELELVQSDIKIVHKGAEHTMRTLTVELFIAQQKRAADHEKMVASGKFSEDEADITDIVSLIRDAVTEFFPTLPVDELETTKLFSIFAWLNEMSAQLNDASAPETDESAEGNEEETES